MNLLTPQEQSGTARRLIAQVWSPSGLTVAVLIGMTLAFYYGLWWPGLVLIKRDAFRFFLPVKQYMVEHLSAGELPQWFPYEALGRPFIGASATGLFHPFTTFYFLLSVPDAYRASVLISCLLAAVGAFALGRLLNFSLAGALLSGITFALSGFVVSLTDHVSYHASVCLLPLFCAALEKALRAPRAWVVVPAALWATVFLHGDIQTGYYYGFVALLWMSMRAQGAYREAALRLALTGGLTALIAGIQLGPALAVFPSTERVHPVTFLEQALHWSTHPLWLLSILASPIGNNADPVVVSRVFFGTSVGAPWSESLYLGIPVVGMALLGAWDRRDLRVLALLASFALFLSLGRYGGLYEVFYHFVPFWSAFRFPEKLMGIATFAIVMLAGAGFDALRAGRGHLAPWLVAAIVCVIVGLGLWTDAARAWISTSFGASEPLTRAMTDSTGLAFLFSAATALGTWLILSRARRHLGKTLSFTLFATLIVLDLSRANLAAYHTGPVEAIILMPPLAKALTTREGTIVPGRFRFVSISEETLVWPADLMRSLGYYGAASVERRQALDLEHNIQFHLESVIPYLPGQSSQLAKTLNPQTGLEAAARLNVTYYIGSRYHLKDPRLAKGLIAELPPYNLALFLNPVPPKPRVYLSRYPEEARSPVDPMALFKRSDFLNGMVDAVETAVALPGPAKGGTARIERYTPEDVRVSVETPQPAVLILLDAYDNGWTAWLDNDKAIPILRANALVRAVVVPTGTHTVTFTYETPLLKAGAFASLVGVLLCLGLLTRLRWQRPLTGNHP